jgi:CubicO group peptidase (beta-lactamase class C family)
MGLVAQGKIDLAAPAHQYVPELRLLDERATQEITVLNLLNHTSGLDWGLIVDTGEGNEALANYVSRMGQLGQITPPGTRASYSQAGYNLVGRIIEKVTGLTYERAIEALLLEPLEMSHSFFNRDDIMTRRFAVGHNPGQDGQLTVARLWRRWRGDNPGGGLASSVADQLRWTRFHLEGGRSAGGVQILPTELLQRMRKQTVELRGSGLGDGIGMGWFLRKVDGLNIVAHGGSANGQFADILMVPERSFAVVTLANAGPNGISFNQAVIRWALENYLGVLDREPEPLPYDETKAAEIVGSYQTDAQLITIRANEGKLTLAAGLKPEIRAAHKEVPPDYEPADFGFLPGKPDEYIITNGGLKGQRGFFTRDEKGAVVGIDLAGRLYKRA